MSTLVRSGFLLLAMTVLFAPPGVASASTGIAGAAGRETVLATPEAKHWGGSETALVVGVGNIAPANDSVTWATSTSAARGMGIYQTSVGSPSWISQFHLPSGSLLLRVEMEACDSTTTAEVGFGITSGLVPGGMAADISATATTGVAATPGCAFFSVAPLAPTTIDNENRNYWLYFYWSGPGLPTVEVHSFRVYYRLQVSPAPLMARFPNDVPTTHPFFRFIEALAASGLTGGCGAGSFCPDSAVTRGQLAVFLSVALGLHFPD